MVCPNTLHTWIVLHRSEMREQKLLDIVVRSGLSRNGKQLCSLPQRAHPASYIGTVRSVDDFSDHDLLQWWEGCVDVGLVIWLVEQPDCGKERLDIIAWELWCQHKTKSRLREESRAQHCGHAGYSQCLISLFGQELYLMRYGFLPFAEILQKVIF